MNSSLLDVNARGDVVMHNEEDHVVSIPRSFGNRNEHGIVEEKWKKIVKGKVSANDEKEAVIVGYDRSPKRWRTDMCSSNTELHPIDMPSCSNSFGVL